MIRFLRALAWLRWRLLVNGLRRSRRRDAVERASRAFEVLVPILLLVLLIPAALILGILGLAAGWFLGAPGAHPGPILVTTRVLLGFAALVMMLAPLLRAMQESTPNLNRLLLLPIPRGSLYLCEALASLADPWLVILIPGVLLLPVGLLSGGHVGSAALALAAGVMALALLVGLGTFSSALANLIFRNRRRGEVIGFVLMLFLSLSGMVPGLLSTFEPVGRRLPDVKNVEAREERRSEAGRDWAREPLPGWALFYPPELYMRCLARAAGHRGPAALWPLFLLSLMTVGVHGVSERVFRRLLETPERASPPRDSSKAQARWFRLPGLNAAASAVALAQVRSVYRTVQGRVILFLIPALVLAMGVIGMRRLEELSLGRLPFPVGVLLAFFGVLFSLLTLEGAIHNQFAMDRAGLTLQFLAPISDRDLIAGKAAGCAFLAGSRALPSFLAAMVVAPGGSPYWWLAVPASGLAVYSLLAPGGAIVSALFPAAGGVSRLGSQGKPHPAASFLGMFLILAGAGPAVSLALVGKFLLRSPALAFLLVSGWAAGAALLSLPLYRMAEKLLARRRENLAMVAQGR